MLGAFLDRLTGTFFSKYFLVSNFFPLLIMASVNAVLLYARGGGSAHFLSTYLSRGPAFQAWWTTSFLIALAIAAYLLSGVSNQLRDFLEGRKWPDTWWFRFLLTDALLARQRLQAAELADRFAAARVPRREFIDGDPLWQKRLAQARETGRTDHPGIAPPTDPGQSTAATVLREATAQLDRNETLDFARFAEVLPDLVAQLKGADANLAASAWAAALDGLQEQFIRTTARIISRLDREYIRLYVEQQSRFSPNVIMPTRFGNAAEALRTYADTRYSLPLDTFWPRFQTVLEGEPAYMASLQDAKAHLDFLISLFWLNGATTLVWLLILGLRHENPVLFVTVALIGPFIMWWWYDLAVTANEAFSETVRSGVDLFRFKLLDALHVRLPPDLATERKLWEELTRTAGYGEPTDLRYTHP